MSVFREVHDVLLAALQTFRSEFTQLVAANVPQFAEYLKGKTGPKPARTRRLTRTRRVTLAAGGAHASCKAELIDIGIPRRDSASGLEEWTRLSAPGALKTVRRRRHLPAPGVLLERIPHDDPRCISIGSDAKKAPKRITRFGMVLSERHPEDRPLTRQNDSKPCQRLLAKIAGFEGKVRQELFSIMMSQFVEAYNLIQDSELATLFDEQALAMITNPPTLPR